MGRLDETSQLEYYLAEPFVCPSSSRCCHSILQVHERTLKRTILACYLAQDLYQVRFAADIFNAAVEVITESFNMP